MFRLVVKSGPSLVGTEITLEPGSDIVLGRADDAGFTLKSSGVSKQHCRILCDADGNLSVEDLGSSNGTSVNGVLIKKKNLKAGDTLGIYKFEIRVKGPKLEKPRMSASTPPAVRLNFSQSRPASSESTRFRSYGNLAVDSQPAAWGSPQISASNTDLDPVQKVPETLDEKIENWADKAIYPLADKLSEWLSIRSLIFISFVAWSLALIFFAIFPFSETANLRVQEKSVEVGKLYARQIVRVNQQSIIEQNYRDLIVQLDARSGQTPGLIEALILDPQKGQVLAPPERLGQGLPNGFAAKAIASDRENYTVDNFGVAYISAPIYVGTSEGNKVAATVFVTFDTRRDNFSLAALFDQAINSLLVSLIFGILILAFQYRWIEGSIRRVDTQLQKTLSNPSSTISSPVVWGPIQELVASISALQGRAAQAGSSANSLGGFSGDVNGEEGAWANRITSALPLVASASFSEDLRVLSWNQAMEKLTGVRATQAVGSDLAQASRDIAFETAIRELSQNASTNIWSEQMRELEFSGTFYFVRVISGPKSFLILITPKEEGGA